MFYLPVESITKCTGRTQVLARADDLFSADIAVGRGAVGDPFTAVGADSVAFSFALVAEGGALACNLAATAYALGGAGV